MMAIHGTTRIPRQNWGTCPQCGRETLHYYKKHKQRVNVEACMAQAVDLHATCSYHKETPIGGKEVRR